MAFQDVENKHYLRTFFVFALFEVLLCSGITFGWASIVYVFKVEHFYISLCGNEAEGVNGTSLNANATAASNLTKIDGEDRLPGCLAQDKMFNLIFTVSLFCFTSVQFFTGIFIDKFGPKVVRVISSVMYVLACLGLGFVEIGYEWLLFPIFIIISIGGGALAMSVYQAANIIYRRNRSKVICILHGAFDSSAVMLLIFKVIYDQQIKYSNIMYGYAAVCLVLNLLGTSVMIPFQKVLLRWSEEEKQIYRKQNPDQNGDGEGPEFMHKSLDASYNSANKKPKANETENKDNNDSMPMEKVTRSTFESDEGGACADESEEFRTNDELPLVEISSDHRSEQSVIKTILSPLYLFELLYVVTFQLKLWYYVGVLADEMIRLTDNNKELVSQYIDIFGYIQFGGIFITPVIGFIFDRGTGKEEQSLLTSPQKIHLLRLRGCIMPFAITGALMIVLCIVSSIPNLQLQILTFFIYMVVRGFLYSNHGAYVGTAFPASQFGTLYGFGVFVAGAVATLQYAFFQMKSELLGGDPLGVNIILLVLVVIGNFHPVYLWFHCRRELKKLL